MTIVSEHIASPQAYKDGLQSGLEDWRVTGSPHGTRNCPERTEPRARSWYLGRVHGFRQAQELIEQSKPTK